MHLIDPCLHASRRSITELELLATAGVTAIIEPSTQAGYERRYVETYLDDFERLLGTEAYRAKQAGLGYGVTLGLAPGESGNLGLASRILEALPRFLNHERVVAIGEIGLERGTDAEEQTFRWQVRLARSNGLPVVVQLPFQNRRDMLLRMLTLLIDEGIPPTHVLVNRVTDDTLPLVRHFGSWYGLTVEDKGPISSERAAQLFMRHGVEGAMIHSSAGSLHGDPLAVPRCVRLMREAGLGASDIEQLAYHNPKWFFSQGRPLPLPATARQSPPTSIARKAETERQMAVNIR